MDDALLVRVAEAQQHQSRSALEIWNARLEILRSAGSLAGLIDHLSAPLVEAGNNCECNTGCNVPCGSNCASLTGEFGREFVNPGP